MASNSSTRDEALSAAVKGVFWSLENGKDLEPSPENCAGFAIHAIEFAQAAAHGLDNPNVSADHAYEALAGATVSMLLALAHFPRFDEITEIKPSNVPHQ